jgi:hypothetical protein
MHMFKYPMRWFENFLGETITPPENPLCLWLRAKANLQLRPASSPDPDPSLRQRQAARPAFRNNFGRYPPI